MKLHEVTTCSGQVIDVKNFPAEGYGRFSIDMVMITVTSFDDMIHEFWFNKAGYDAFGMASVAFPKNIVTVSCYNNIKDETYYLNEDDAEVIHEKTWLEMINIYHCSDIIMSKHGLPEFLMNRTDALRESAKILTKATEVYHAGNDDKVDAEKLIDKYNRSANDVFKKGIKEQLERLGYKYDDIINNFVKK